MNYYLPTEIRVELIYGGVMNLKLLMGVALLAVSAVFAQEEETFGATPAAEPVTAPVAAPVVEAPAPLAVQTPVSSVSKFDQLRGNAYNFVGNEAAASTVNDYLARPHSFAGSKLLYIEPTYTESTRGERGLVAWGSNTTYFVDLNNSQDLGLLTVGMAKKDAFGLSLHLALGQFYTSDDNGSSGVTEAGDDWGANFSMPVNGLVFAASLDWLTTAAEVGSDPDGEGAVETTEDYWDLTLNANLNNGPSAGAVTWTVGLNFLRHVISTETGKVTSVDLNTRTEFTPYFNLGGKILGNDNARVFIGSNNKLPVQIFDGYDGDTDSFSAFATGLIVSPNILGELALTDNFLLFGGATHNWLVFGYGSESYETKATLATPSTTSDVSYLQSKMNTTTATVGMRFQKSNYAAEFNLGDEVFHGTHAILNGSSTFVSFGGFIYF
jgi:hypothetical protein